MKPKYHQILRHLPATVFIAASLPITAQAGIFADDTAGNASPTAADNGANTIRANGGTNVTNPLVSIIGGPTGVSMTGDAAETEVLEITNTNYTVNNSGSLSGTNHHGINSTQAFTLSNSGTIAGGGAGRNGVLSTIATITNNYSGGSITGTVDAIRFTANGGTIDNFGSISGDTNGVNVLSGAIINNNTTFLIGPDAGGQIIGLDGNGVTATSGLTLTNEALGLIQGSVSGVNAGDNAIITNRGTITGAIDSGIRVGDAANITNSGSIQGDDYAINLSTSTTATVNNQSGGIIGGLLTNDFGILGDTGIETVTNAGTISGDIAALQLNGGANIVNLNNGSVINGNVRASDGSNTINFNGGESFWGDSTLNIVNGGVFDASAINKTGSGLAVIDGIARANTISVSDGELFILGNVTNAAGGENTVSASGFGTIGGLGIWDSNITLTGNSIITPGETILGLAPILSDSIGTLTVTGDVTLGSNATYEWNVTPSVASPSDLIRLTGATNQFSTTATYFSIAPTDVNTPLYDGSTIVVATDASLVGFFDSNIQLTSFADSDVVDDGPYQANEINPIIAANFSELNKINGDTDWELTITHDYSQFGTTPNQVAAGEMLNDLYNNSTNADVLDLLAALDYSDAQTTTNTLAALDPGAYLATLSGLANNNYSLHRTVETHNAAVRAGSGSVTMSAPESSAKGAVAPAPVASGCGGCSNVWGSFSYDWQDLNSSNSAFDQDGNTASFTAGIDFTVAENFRLGLVGQGAQTDWDGEGSLDSEIESYRLAAYANWGAATGWFIDALVGYNTHSVDQSRATQIANILGVSSSDYDADGWQGMISAGYAMQTSAGLFSPFIGLEWQQLSADSATVDGPISIGLSSTDIDSFRGLIGVKWEADLADQVKAYATAAYAYEFEDDAANAKVSFAGSSYTAEGLEQGDAVLVSAGLRWEFIQCTTLDLGYRGEFAMDDGVDSNGANIGLNYSF